MSVYIVIIASGIFFVVVVLDKPQTRHNSLLLCSVTLRKCFNKLTEVWEQPYLVAHENSRIWIVKNFRGRYRDLINIYQ
jgi:hypothetical protein